MITEYKKIAILVPTRDARPSVRDLVESWKATTSGFSDLILGIDMDQVKDYNVGKIKEEGVLVNILPRMNLCPKLNVMSKVDKRSIIGFVGDDVVFRSKGWEEEVISWMEENHSICYGNDLLQGEDLPNNVFIDKSIIDILGAMVSPKVQHYYCDNFWKDLGLRIENIKYFPDMIFEHRHWSNEKSDKDDLYKESEKFFSNDQEIYHQYILNGEIDKDVEKVLKIRSSYVK